MLQINQQEPSNHSFIYKMFAYMYIKAILIIVSNLYRVLAIDIIWFNHIVIDIVYSKD